MGNYVSQEQVEARLSQVMTRRIFDDDNDGEADTGALDEIITAAEDWFESVAICVYPILTELRAGGGAPAKQLVMNCVVAIACQRFPRAAGRDWQPLWDLADKQLMRLRKAEIKLPVQGTPNPPINVGGDYFLQGEGIADDPAPTFTRNGFGSF